MPTRQRPNERVIQPGASQGPAVDITGTPIVDPTANVIALTQAEAKRQDDLRLAEARYNAARIKAVRREAKIYAEHAREVRLLEADRLDKIRQIDVAATAREAERAQAAINVLAAKATADAENIRTALNNTAATIAKQTSDTVGEITTRIAALEKANSEALGRATVANPQLDDLLREMRQLRTATDASSGERRGGTNTVNWLIAAVGALVGIGGFVAAMIAIFTKP